MTRDTCYALSLGSDDTSLSIKIPLKESIALLNATNTIFAIVKIFTNRQMRINGTAARWTARWIKGGLFGSDATRGLMLRHTFSQLLVPVMSTATGKLQRSRSVTQKIFLTTVATREVGRWQGILTRTWIILLLFPKIHRRLINQWCGICKYRHIKFCRRFGFRPCLVYVYRWWVCDLVFTKNAFI